MCAPVNHSPLVCLLSFILLYKAVLYGFFVSFILSHWLHHYLYNYFATIFSHFWFCFSFNINLTNIQLSHTEHVNKYFMGAQGVQFNRLFLK